MLVSGEVGEIEEMQCMKLYLNQVLEMYQDFRLRSYQGEYFRQRECICESLQVSRFKVFLGDSVVVLFGGELDEG